MKLDINDKYGMDFVIILDGVLQTTCIEADDRKGYIIRYQVDNNMLCRLDKRGKPRKEKVKGNVEFVRIDEYRSLMKMSKCS